MGEDYSGIHIETTLKQLFLCAKSKIVGYGNEQCIQSVLASVMNICTKIYSAKDILRDIGGLSFLIDFVCSTDDALCLEYGLKTLSCAVDQNTFNQREVTKNDIFILIRNTLAKENISPSLLKSAILLTSTILYQNVMAQNMLRDSGCMQCYADLYQELFPSFMLGHVSLKSNNSDARLASTEMWQAVSTVLCFSMTNPIHVHNQERCAKLLPVALKILQLSSYYEIVCSVSLFLSSLILDNARNLDLLVKNDGLSIFKHCLEVGVISTIASSSPSQGDIQATVHVICLIDLCISGNEKNAYLLGKMDVVSLISKLLFTNFLDDVSEIKVLLTLGHFIEACPSNTENLLYEENFKSFLEKNSQSDNDNLLKACQYVIHLMLMHGTVKHVSVLKSSLCPAGSWHGKSSVDSASCVTDLNRKISERASYEPTSSSGDSSSEQSRIELSKTKEERVKQYLEELNYCSSENSTSKKCHKYKNKAFNEVNRGTVPVSVVDTKQERNSYLFKNFGSHHALSKFSEMAINNSDNNKSEIHKCLVSPELICKTGNICQRSNIILHNPTLHNIPELSVDENAALNIASSSLCSKGCPSCSRKGKKNINNNIVKKSETPCVHELEQLKTFKKCNESVTCTKCCSSCLKSFIKPKGIPHRQKIQMPNCVTVPTNCSAKTSQIKPSQQKILLNSSFNSHVAMDTPTSKSRKRTFSALKNSSISSSEMNSQNMYAQNYKHRKVPLNVSLKENVLTCSQISSFSPFRRDSVHSVDQSVDLFTTSAEESHAKQLALHTQHCDDMIDVTPKENLSERKHTFLNGSSSSVDIEPYFSVLVFPSTKCSLHGLVNSTEKMWFMPIEGTEH